MKTIKTMKKTYSISLESDTDSIGTGPAFSSKKNAIAYAKEIERGEHRQEKGYRACVHDGNTIVYVSSKKIETK